MEIAVLPKSGIRIKGKHAVIVVNPGSKEEANATILTAGSESVFLQSKGVIIASPGEYEVSGMKIRGSLLSDALSFSLDVDGVSVLLATLSSLEKSHGKLSEHDVVIIDADEVKDASFASSLAVHALLFSGAKAKEVADSLAKEDVKKTSKFSSTREKLPQEMETILLQ